MNNWNLAYQILLFCMQNMQKLYADKLLDKLKKNLVEKVTYCDSVQMYY